MDLRRHVAHLRVLLMDAHAEPQAWSCLEGRSEAERERAREAAAGESSGDGGVGNAGACNLIYNEFCMINPV